MLRGSRNGEDYEEVSLVSEKGGILAGKKISHPTFAGWEQKKKERVVSKHKDGPLLRRGVGGVTHRSSKGKQRGGPGLASELKKRKWSISVEAIMNKGGGCLT